MFTGIIECVGTIGGNDVVAGGRRMRVNVDALPGEPSLGCSVCVSGVCLTVVGLTEQTLEFDVIQETLDKSTLGAKRVGDSVNLEASLRIGDRLDGHFVQGHVDGTATIEQVRKSTAEHVVWLSPQSHLAPYMIPKGSVAVDGVSLTIADTRGGAFCVALIPTTLERTTFSKLSPGDRVNIESDIIARTVVHHVTHSAQKGHLSLDTLRAAGFA